MAFAKKKILTSPLGTCEPYAYIAKPDFGGQGFENPRGTYKVSLTIPNESCQKMVDAIVKCHEESYAARLEAHEANPPKVVKGKKQLQPYEGDLPFIDNDDGTTTFNFKCYGSFEDKKSGETRKINLTVVDSMGKKMQDVPMIAGGSKLKIKFSLVPYGWSAVAGASVKLQLEGVMLVELATFGGESDDWGDDVEEGGYVASGDAKSKPRDADNWNQHDSEGQDSDDSDEGEGDF